MEDVNLNEKSKIILLKNGMELQDGEIEKIYGENIVEKLLETDFVTKEFRDTIAKGMLDDKVDSIFISIEYRRADRL